MRGNRREAPGTRLKIGARRRRRQLDPRGARAHAPPCTADGRTFPLLVSAQGRGGRGFACPPAAALNEDFMRRCASMLVFSAIAVGAVSLAGHAFAQASLRRSWSAAAHSLQAARPTQAAGLFGARVPRACSSSSKTGAIHRSSCAPISRSSAQEAGFKARPKKTRRSFRAPSRASGPIPSTRARRLSRSNGRPTPSLTCWGRAKHALHHHG